MANSPKYYVDKKTGKRFEITYLANRSDKRKNKHSREALSLLIKEEWVERNENRKKELEIKEKSENSSENS